MRGNLSRVASELKAELRTRFSFMHVPPLLLSLN